ncbi:TIGR04326 family surface carbohydrate biosynthesis protein [Gemmatimonadota bacterium]
MKLILLQSERFRPDISLDGEIAFWDSHCETESGLSIPAHVERNADRLRAKYLEWTCSLGEFEIGGKSVAEHLMIRSGFSYWWMTLLAEKSNGKSPRIYDVVRLLAVEEIITDRGVSELEYHGDDRLLHRTFREMCRSLCVSYHHSRSSPRGGFHKIVKRSFSYTLVRGIISVLQRIAGALPSLIGRGKAEDFEADVLFVSYFCNVDRRSVEEGFFETPYWARLHGKIRDWKVPVRWCHIFSKTSQARSPAQAGRIIKFLNESDRETELHYLLERSLTPSLLITALRDWVFLWCIGIKLRGIKRAFVVPDSVVPLWHLMSHDWVRSIYGTDAVVNCLFLALFESFCEELPYQRVGLYLMENQAWERALAYSWSKCGHGALIGVQHSTVRYWDLRHHNHPSVYSSSEAWSIPLPSFVGLNGPPAYRSYLDSGFPEPRVIKLDALRFLYLSEIQSPTNPLQSRSINATNRVLVFCDYSRSTTDRLLDLIQRAVDLVEVDVRFYIKAHPDTPVNVHSYPELKMVVIDAIEAESLASYDLAVCSNMTSANLDAHFSGLPVVSMLDGDRFNLNPQRGLGTVSFVSTPRQLAEIIRGDPPAKNDLRLEDYFYSDSNLETWERLLKPGGQVT